MRTVPWRGWEEDEIKKKITEGHVGKGVGGRRGNRKMQQKESRLTVSEEFLFFQQNKCVNLKERWTMVRWDKSNVERSESSGKGQMMEWKVRVMGGSSAKRVDSRNSSRFPNISHHVYCFTRERTGTLTSGSGWMQLTRPMSDYYVIQVRFHHPCSSLRAAERSLACHGLCASVGSTFVKGQCRRQIQTHWWKNKLVPRQSNL